jgi:GNAT superfamily N-acetyltransferase
MWVRIVHYVKPEYLMSITIRSAHAEDIPQIFQFICDLAEYEKALHEVKCTPESLLESLFGSGTVAFTLMVEDHGRPIGYAIYFFNYSTWLAAKGLYLEDLYVDPDSRGKGAGIKLMKHLAKEAVEQGCRRFEWSVLDWNTPSRSFYESIGSKSMKEWISYRLDGEELEKFGR